jgi:hypothetical protein
LAALTPVVEALERLGVSYYIGGSIASQAYGAVRSTLDVDLVADLRPEHVAPLVEALRKTYYVSAPMISEAVARRSCFNVIHTSTSFKVDVFCAKNRVYDRLAMRRARKDSIDAANPSAQFALASPEDIVLAKLEWFRLGDEVSGKQWTDVVIVLKVQQHCLDRQYLETWAVELGVGDLLAKAWKEAEF